MSFPATRLRRLRRTPGLRALVRETEVRPGDLIQPIFVVHGEGEHQPIASMPGQARMSVDGLAKLGREALELGLGGVILFGVPAAKDASGSSAFDPSEVVPRAIAKLKSAAPDLPVIADVCCCEYTDHGHCGVLAGETVDNDRTLEVLARAAVVYAEAGADIVAPSDMMDGRVGAIRRALDGARFADVSILSYAIKYASAYYGPFRQAADCAPRFGDRRGYQMDPGNVREALREAELDVAEGADALLVKPALPYLDVIARVRERFPLPIAAYQVSGEYAQIKAAAANGWLDESAAVAESLVAMRRAGADMILTYFALDFARRQA